MYGLSTLTIFIIILFLAQFSLKFASLMRPEGFIADFPRLFFYNTWNTYLIGLDPTYLQMKDPDLFDLWVEITKGREKRPSVPIYERFAAEFVITDLAHDGFIDRASEDTEMEELYKDEEAIIYRVHPAGG